MFTGIVQSICKISNIIDHDNCRRLCIMLGDLSINLRNGSSIAVNGVCLTVTKIENNIAEFDIVLESLKKSNLGYLKIGEYVNIERACRLGDEVGGHNVSGHVDSVAKINKIIRKDNLFNIFFKYEVKWFKYLFPKGSIAIDGVSLTIVEVKKDFFSVSLIPETIKNTLFGFKNEGDTVNLEFDINAKIIVETIKRSLKKLK